MAVLDFAAFAVIFSAGWLAPAAANFAARALAVACQAAFRRDYASRTRSLMRNEGRARCLVTFAGHLVLTTVLLAGLVRLGAPPVPGKALAQLTGYLGTFIAVDAYPARGGPAWRRVCTANQTEGRRTHCTSRSCRWCYTIHSRHPLRGHGLSHVPQPPSSAHPPCTTPLPFGSS